MMVTREYIAGILCAMQVAGDDESSAAIERFIAQLEARNAALQEYATHKPGCYESGDECICGLDALLTGE